MKRYVLLEDKIIVDTLVIPIREAGLYKGKTILHDLEHGFFVGYLKQQSDNLLDLAEVGDCVEHNINNETVIIHMGTINNVEFQKDLNACIAIWKRNGDVMRRYEVKE